MPVLTGVMAWTGLVVGAAGLNKTRPWDPTLGPAPGTRPWDPPDNDPVYLRSLRSGHVSQREKVVYALLASRIGCKTNRRV